jgi:hypothetical protein
MILRTIPNSGKKGKEPMASHTCGPLRESGEQAGYQIVSALEDGQYLLEDEMGKQEIWRESSNYAGYALTFGDTELEFIRDAARQ